MTDGETSISATPLWLKWYGAVAVCLVILCFIALALGLLPPEVLRLAFIGTFFSNVAGYIFNATSPRLRNMAFAFGGVGIFFLAAAVSEMVS